MTEEEYEALSNGMKSMGWEIQTLAGHEGGGSSAAGSSGGGVGLPGLTIFQDKLGITETQWNRVAAVIKKFETVDKEGSAMYSKMADYDTNGKLSDNGRRLLNDLEESGLFLWKHRLVLWVFI